MRMRNELYSIGGHEEDIAPIQLLRDHFHRDAVCQGMDIDEFIIKRLFEPGVIELHFAGLGNPIYYNERHYYSWTIGGNA